jgi:hypothetical protein
MILSGLCVSAKADFFQGIHQPGDRYMVALYTTDADLSPLTDVYSKTGEAKGKGYQAGGVPLQGFSVHIEGVKAIMGWDRGIVIPNATISARGALIYNASRQGKAIGVIDFKETITSTNGNFKFATNDLFWIA